MKCPTCTTELRMSERHGVEIDYCPDCRGVWLDRGELDKIIAQAADDRREPEAPFSEPRHEYAREDGRRYDGYDNRNRRKKSFFGELFDFD